MVMLLRPGVSLVEGRRQLGLASGHISATKTGYIDRFFELYENWLAAEGKEHSPAVFERWARNHYRPDAGWASYALVDPPGPEIRTKAGQARVVKVRCRNLSTQPWRFSSGLTAGVHGLWRVVNDGDTVVAMGRMGLRNATVPPGEHIDLELGLPALPVGRFQLVIDMTEEQHAMFSQLGCPILCVDVVVA
jgi:hypothetical protein